MGQPTVTVQNKLTVAQVIEVRDNTNNQHTIDVCNVCLWHADVNGEITSLTYATDYVRACVIARADAIAQGRL